MNKAELVKYMAQDTDLTKAACMDVLNSFIEAVETEVLTNGMDITISGFGKFHLKKTKARLGVNPQNPSEKVNIPAGRSVKFTPFAGLKQKDD
jgi:DNA-binding protein HU-beta